jgi:hypothetical protein
MAPPHHLFVGVVFRVTGRHLRTLQVLQCLLDAFSAVMVDPWQALEVAWRELPPPRADAILLGRDDYGAVRGFLHPRNDHRWTRPRAWLRLVPATPAPAYDVTLAMGSPEPSANATPTVHVRGNDDSGVAFTLSRQVQPHSFRVRSPLNGPLIVEIRAPTWNLCDEPPEQGIRVDQMTVVPAR